MKIGEAEKYISKQLSAMYDDTESTAMAALVLEACTGSSRTGMLLGRGRELSPDERLLLDLYLQRLQTGEPIQYILNKAPFYGLELYIDKAVLIPRPETEELVDWIVKDVKASGMNVFEKNATDADVTTQLKILDIGTGSGSIALALKKTLPKAEIWACDVSEEALNVARRNGSALNIRVDFQGIDFLDEAGQKSLPTVDIIVSNPPYVPVSEKSSMKENVVHYEPPAALFVPDNDPLLFYKSIARFGKKRLYPTGAVYLEIHEKSGKEVVTLFKNEGYQNVELRKDMQGKDRMVKAHPGPIPDPSRWEGPPTAQPQLR